MNYLDRFVDTVYASCIFFAAYALVSAAIDRIKSIFTKVHESNKP